MADDFYINLWERPVTFDSMTPGLSLENRYCPLCGYMTPGESCNCEGAVIVATGRAVRFLESLGYKVEPPARRSDAVSPIPPKAPDPPPDPPPAQPLRETPAAPPAPKE